MTAEDFKKKLYIEVLAAFVIKYPARDENDHRSLVNYAYTVTELAIKKYNDQLKSDTF